MSSSRYTYRKLIMVIVHSHWGDLFISLHYFAVKCYWCVRQQQMFWMWENVYISLSSYHVLGEKVFNCMRTHDRVLRNQAFSHEILWCQNVVCTKMKSIVNDNKKNMVKIKIKTLTKEVINMWARSVITNDCSKLMQKEFFSHIARNGLISEMKNKRRMKRKTRTHRL